MQVENMLRESVTVVLENLAPSVPGPAFVLGQVKFPLSFLLMCFLPPFPITLVFPLPEVVCQMP